MTESSSTEETASLSPTEEIETEQVVYQCPEGDYENPNFNSVRAHCQRKHRYRIELRNGIVTKIEPSEKRVKERKAPEVPTIPPVAIKPTVKPAITTEEVKVKFSPETEQYIADMVEEITVKTLETRLGAIDQRQQRYGYRYKPPYQQRNEGLGAMSDLELAETLRVRRKQEQELHEIEMARKQGHSSQYTSESNPVITNLQDQITKLTEKLEEEREKRKEDRLKGIEDSVKDLRTEMKTTTERAKDFYSLGETTIKELGSLLRYDLRARFRLENPEERVEREKIPTPEGEPTLAERIRMEHPDLVEEGD